MFFNSIEFAVFLPVVFVLYWFVFKNNLKQQNALIVVASYYFYGCWDWRFLSLILFSTVVDYYLGLKMEHCSSLKRRKLFLSLSIIVNLGFLGFFKYFNFFLDNISGVFSFFGNPIEIGTLEIILPVGISFYTFQTLSYTIDVYRGKLKPTKDFIAFTAFVSFFPQLVAGPIERATHLLPQFYKKRKFSYALAADGGRQILWGLFKKIVIADNCAELVNQIYYAPEDVSGFSLFLAAVLFTIQIYGDFSGYSDIAIGTARLFGFDLMQNFAFPYFSRDAAEFWRRWHISLSTWFRDYVYIPLGGSRVSHGKVIRNTFIIFLVSGFWHGANWTFIVWGGLNAIYFLPLMLLGKNRNNIGVVAEGRVFPKFKEVIQMVVTFFLMAFAWIFFRATDFNHAFLILKGIFSPSLFSIVDSDFWGASVKPIPMFLLIIIFLCVEWFGREGKHALENFGRKGNVFLRYTFYYTLGFMIIWFTGKEQAFIYFQF